MLLTLGPHAGFIVASYAAMIAVILALAVWLWLDGRRYKRALAELTGDTDTRAGDG